MNPYHYAVVVGISQYLGVKDLDGPVRDATAFRDWLVSDGGLPAENIALLTSPEPPLSVELDAFDGRPTKREIDRLLESMNKKAHIAIGHDAGHREQSRLYLYVAGHGIMPFGGECALLLGDARPGMYENFELGAYATWYRKSGIFGELVIFADCCRNWFPQVPRSIVPFDDPADQGSRVYSLMGYAAGPGDPAYEKVEAGVPGEERRGYFTSALLEGLRGAAAIDPDSQSITSTTLTKYVRLKVAQETARKAVPQEVQMPAEPAAPIVFLGRNDKLIAARPASYPVILHFPAGWTSAVELQTQGSGRLLYDQAPTPWELDLPSGLYGVYLPGTWDTTGLNNPTFTVTGVLDVQL